MIVMLIGHAPEIQAQLSTRNVVASTLRAVEPDEMPSTLTAFTALVDDIGLPDVVIVAPKDDPRTALPLIKNLPVEQHIGVVVALPQLDTAFAVDALRNGASDVISVEPSLEDLRSALARASVVSQQNAKAELPAGTSPLPAERGVVIGVGSAVGGVGKTFAAINLALGIDGSNPGSTCLVDAATQFGGVADQLDLVPNSTMPDIVAAADNPILAKTHLSMHSSGLYVAPASDNPAALDRTDPSRVAETIEMLAHQFSTVVVDLDSGLGSTVLEMLIRVDELLVVCDFTVHSLRATRHYLDSVELIPRHTPLLPRLLLNRYDDRLAVRQRDAEQTVGRDADLVLQNMPQIALAGNVGRPPMLEGHRDKVRRHIAPLVSLFHPHDDPKRLIGKVA